MSLIYYVYNYDYANSDSTLEIDLTNVPDACSGYAIDIMVENLGRSNFGEPHTFDQRKGIWEGNILLNGKPLTGWKNIPMRFNTKWVNRY